MTLAVASAMTALLFGIGAAVYWSMSASLLDTLDSGLRFRAAQIMSLPASAPIETVNPLLQERGESFDQLVAADGRVLRGSPGLQRTPLIGATELSRLHGPRFYVRHVPGVQNQARLLALPSHLRGTRTTLIVGTTMADRADALHHLALIFALAGPLGIAAAAGVGWWVAGLGLAPVERMRRQAAAIDTSGRDRRLDVPPADDELRRLATTLNQMLDRLSAAADHDRDFFERASHELRTPLTALKAELDLAAGETDVNALAAAVASARDETDRLVMLANDLLTLARAHGGRIPVRRSACDLHELLAGAAAAHRARALSHGITIDVHAPATTAHVDGAQLRQAVDNLLDNAIRHGGAVTRIVLTGRTIGERVEISVRDNGCGFPAAPTAGRPGLGLAVARAVVLSHGGDLATSNLADGGAEVTLSCAHAFST